MGVCLRHPFGAVNERGKPKRFPRYPLPPVTYRCLTRRMGGNGRETFGFPLFVIEGISHKALHESFVPDAVGFIGIVAEALPSIRHVILVVAFEPDDLAFVFERENVRGDAIEEPAIV